MTSPLSAIAFGPFRLDLGGGGLRSGDARVAIQARPLAVLRYLAERPGRVVSADELLREVWEGVVVTRGALKVAVRALREALGDDADEPRYVETVGREGYRFLGDAGGAARRAPAATPRARARAMVGRDRDLARLLKAHRESSGGARRIVLVSGEAGIGKTTLVDRLLDEVARSGTFVARGQCLERHGEGEAYLPVLEALGRLARDGDGDWLAAALRSHAPSWAAQIAGLGDADPDDRDAWTPERMLRELADALAVATRARSLVLALEDLHWSDHATLDLLSCIAQRREAARLLVVGTYRPSDVADGHPLRSLKQHLVAKGQCEELSLELLACDDVAEYLRRELGDSADLPALAGALHAHTAGNALFMASVVDDLLSGNRVLREASGWHLAGTAAEATETVPAGVQQLIEQQVERLPIEDQRVLESASAAGAEFTAASVAAALDLDAEDVEARCEALAARAQFIAPAGLVEWPDATLSGRYRFRHPLRSHVLYARIPEPRRVRLHRAIAAREEAGWGARASEIAAELAAHFELGREPARAVPYREAAGRTALRRLAPREAAAHYDRALALLGELPDARERDEAELRVRVALAAPLMALRGYAAPEVGESYERARALGEQLGADRELLPVLRGLASYHQVRGSLGLARALGVELLARAEASGDAFAQVQAHYGHGVTLYHAGEPVAARGHLERALALYRPDPENRHVRVYGGYEPRVACRFWLAWTLRVLGFPAEGRAEATRALALAEALDHPPTRAFAHYGMAVTQQTLGERDAMLRSAERAIALAGENGSAYELALATIIRGWALALTGRLPEGVAELERGVERYTATGARLATGYHMLLAAACGMAGRDAEACDRARRTLDAAKGREGELDAAPLRCGAARIFLAFAAHRPDAERRELEREAEALLDGALAIAREQQALQYELLAAVNLARLWEARGRRGEARELLAPVVGRFGAGRETNDVREAARLLARWA